MNILVIQNGSIADAMITTSILTKMVRDGHCVHCITNQNVGGLFPAINGVRVDYLPEINISDCYDLAVNLYPDEISGMVMNRANANIKRGYGFDGEHIVFFDKSSDIHYRTTRLGIWNDSNLFQLVYGMAGMTWNGEGYNVRYFPRNRQRKSMTGLCINDAKLHQYILNNLRISGIIVTVPLKQNILKQVDEINRCKKLVTDDDGCMHIGLSLHKHVEYITKRPPAYDIEMFGSGNMHIFNPASLEANG